MQAKSTSKFLKIMGSHQVPLWLGLNLLDLVLSLICLHYRGQEFNPMMTWLLDKVPRLTEYNELSFIWYGAYKMGLAVFVLLLLDRIKKLHLLKWLNICLGCLCLYYLIILIITFSL